MMITANDTQQTLRTEKRKRGFLYMFLLLVFLALVMAIIYVVGQQNIMQEREIEQYAELDEIHNKVITELNAAGVDLIYYAHSELAIATLSSQDQVAKSYLASLMYDISSLHKRYAQIRIFDKQGDEVIRIDQRADYSLTQIPESKLQNKSQRYYFQSALALDPGEIYISEFDLNKERGKIEYPIKPMLRFATPVYSPKGEFIGVGAINYDGKNILQIIADSNKHKGKQVYLLNNDGYYLKGNNPEKEWGFILSERARFQFSREHPEVWEKMIAYEDKKMITDEGEYYYRYFYLSPILPFHAINTEGVFLVIHVPESVIQGELANLLKSLVIVFLLLAPMLSFLAYKLAYSQVEQDWLFKKLKFEARHDALTGLYNRPAIVGYLQKSISISRRRNAPLTVAFIDINDLKKMNDVYGHEAGDELIKGAANAINASIRTSDFAARLGGDEFLIICVDCDKKSAELTMQRVQNHYDLSGRKIGKKWSLSFGCAQLLEQEDDVDKLIERADKAMYKHKKRIKKGIIDPVK